MNSSRFVDLNSLEDQVFRFALEQVDEAMVILQAEPLMKPGPRIAAANRKASELTGLPIEELTASPISRIFDDDWVEDFLRRLPVVAEKKRKFQTDKRLVGADGSLRLCRWTVRGMVDEAGRPVRYLLAFRENGADGAAAGGKRTERGLPDSIDLMLERSRMESLALLTVGVAHDFNNVLTTIGTHLAMAKLATSTNSPVRERLDAAEAAMENGQALTDQLLTFAKGNAPKRCKGNLGEILRQAERLAMIGSRVRCDLSVANSLWSCRVEETQILQVFHNLLVNARQSMPDGGIVQVSCENVEMGGDSPLRLKPGPYVVTSVRDHGCGIPPEQLGRIFEPYFTTKPKGTGIGLATCQLAVRRHDGLITVRSKVDVGTEFRVYLPATGEAAPVVAGGLEVSNTVKMKASRDESILVVDDHEEVRVMTVKLLKALGYDAVAAFSGEEALKLYLERLHSGSPFAAVLMDMTLPGGMSGEETFREIRNLDPQARAIATSGNLDGEEGEFHSRGYAGVLAKPYTAEKLGEKLGSVLTA